MRTSPWTGRETYDLKRPNNERSNETKRYGDLGSAVSEPRYGRRSDEIAQVSDTQPGNTIPMPTSRVAAARPTDVIQPPITGPENENQNFQGWHIFQGNRRGSRSGRQSMYRAALEGDWVAAEMLMERERTLLCDEITESGDRALHIAAAMKHKEFVEKLVQRMTPSDLELLDGYGYTACCYAAISGTVEIADVMMKKNPNLATKSNDIGRTPLHRAALRGNAKMVSYFLKSIKVERLSKKEWFDLFMITVFNKMYDVALEILKMDGSLATMRNNEGTALHLLARLDISDFSTVKKPTLLEIYFGTDAAFNGFPRKMRSDIRLLAKELWAEIQKLEQDTMLELIKNPPILHEAAKVGNVELITMLTHTYPDLIWERDSNGHTIFHIAVMYRQTSMFRLIHQIGAMKDLILVSQDYNGNNILHLAGELGPLNRRRIVFQSAFQMHTELAWFKEVEAIVPPFCLDERNKDRQTPRELFSKQHKSLLEKSETWMRNTTDSCMLIATIMLTVVFAAAFTVPGGNNGATGIPVLFKTNWFTCFVIFEALALFGSTLCIIMFWSIMTSSFEEDQFLKILPYQLKMGFSGLFGSLVSTLSAFMSAYFLAFVEERARLVECVIISIYVVLVLAIFSEFSKLWLHTNPLGHLSRILSRPSSYSLFSRNDTTGKE